MLFSYLFPIKTSISKHLFKQSFGSLLFSLGMSLVDSGRYSVFFIKCLSLISRKKMLHHLTYKWDLKRSKLIEAKLEWCFPRTEEEDA